MIRRTRNQQPVTWRALGCALALVLAGLGVRTAEAKDSPASTIVRLVSVGSILTADGTIWQFDPEDSRWLTIDQAFAKQGEDTHVLPLPVRPEEITEMLTFGFLRTRDGKCWLYDLDSDKWTALPPPPAR